MLLPMLVLTLPNPGCPNAKPGMDADDVGDTGTVGTLNAAYVEGPDMGDSLGAPLLLELVP